jgi:hypothetical protein
MGELCLDEGEIDVPGAKEAEVEGFDARSLTRSASGLADDVRLRNSLTVGAGHPVDVGQYAFGVLQSSNGYSDFLSKQLDK